MHSCLSSLIDDPGVFGDHIMRNQSSAQNDGIFVMGKRYFSLYARFTLKLHALSLPIARFRRFRLLRLELLAYLSVCDTREKRNIELYSFMFSFVFHLWPKLCVCDGKLCDACVSIVRHLWRSVTLVSFSPMPDQNQNCPSALKTIK